MVIKITHLILLIYLCHLPFNDKEGIDAMLMMCVGEVVVNDLTWVEKSTQTRAHSTNPCNLLLRFTHFSAKVKFYGRTSTFSAADST